MNVSLVDWSLCLVVCLRLSSMMTVSCSRTYDTSLAWAPAVCVWCVCACVLCRSLSHATNRTHQAASDIVILSPGLTVPRHQPHAPGCLRYCDPLARSLRHHHGPHSCAQGETRGGDPGKEFGTHTHTHTPFFFLLRICLNPYCCAGLLF